MSKEAKKLLTLRKLYFAWPSNRQFQKSECWKLAVKLIAGEYDDEQC